MRECGGRRNKKSPPELGMTGTQTRIEIATQVE